MPNEQGLYTPEEFDGLLNDKQGEVRHRQQLQAELAVKGGEMEKLNARIKSLETSTAEEKAGNLDDNITRRDLLKALKDQRKELTEEYKQDKQSMTKQEREAAIDASFEKARGIMTEKKMGKGLSFDEVWEGTKRVLLKKPALRAVITSSTNPGQEAYDIGLQDPTIAQRVALDKKNFPDSKRTPKIGMESTDIPTQFFSQERVSKMEKEEIKANLSAIRDSQKKWKK